jgi:hypothetical protein
VHGEVDLHTVMSLEAHWIVHDTKRASLFGSPPLSAVARYLPAARIFQRIPLIVYEVNVRTRDDRRAEVLLHDARRRRLGQLDKLQLINRGFGVAPATIRFEIARQLRGVSDRAVLIGKH